MEITKENLEAMYNSMTCKELCISLGISYPTLRKIVIANNIKPKGKGNRVSRKKIKVI